MISVYKTINKWYNNITENVFQGDIHMKFRKTIAAFLSVLFTAVLISSCTKEFETIDNKTIKVLIKSSNIPDNWDKIINKFETESGTGIKLDTEFVSDGDYKDKLNMRMTAGEEYDLVFDAPWLLMPSFISSGIYAPIEDYFNNDNYPGLKQAFSKEMIEANKYNGHLYSVPVMRTYGSGIYCIYYRKDLCKKYNIPEITTQETFENYLQTINFNESGMIPLSVTASRGFFNMYLPDEVELAQNHIVKISKVGGTAYVLLNRDNNSIKSIAYEGDHTDAFKDFPAPYNDPYGENGFLSMYNTHRRLNRYLSTDSLNSRDSTAELCGDKGAAMISSLDSYELISKSFYESLPDAELGYWIYNPKSAAMANEARITTLEGNNFLCVPAVSDKVDLTMKFLDWLYANQDNHDLFELGIEGEDWNKIGDDKYEIVPGSDYNFPGYALTWNPNYVRFDTALPEDVFKYKKYDLSPSSYYISPIAGFHYDSSKTQSEIVTVNGILAEVDTALAHGALENPIEILNANRAKAKKAGRDIIEEDFRNQLTEFLNNR